MPGRVVRFDVYEVDFDRRELRKRGVRVGLQHKPFRVLELLLRHPGELVTREELIGCLWPDSHVSFAHGLNTAVNSLRQALGESSHGPQFIETRPGLGYRFSASVTETNQIKNPSAYEDCLKGRYFLDLLTEGETYKAIAFFKAALADKTCDALAQAGIADSCCQLALLGSASSTELAFRARSASAMALGSDAGLSQAHVSAGHVKMIFDWDWAGAQEAASRALRLDARSVPAHLLHASLLFTLGRFEDALQVSRCAILLDPLSFPANLQLAACLYAVRDFQSAVNQCWNILTLTSQFAPAQLLLALSYEQLGLYEEAAIEFENAKRCAGFESAAASGLGHLLAVAGTLNDTSLSCYGRALVSTALGQKHQALVSLEDSLKRRESGMLWIAADARFDSLREDDRFHLMLSQLGVERVFARPG